MKKINLYNIFIISITLVLIAFFIFTIYRVYIVTLEEAKESHQSQQLEMAKTASIGLKYYIDYLIEDLVSQTENFKNDYSGKLAISNRLNKEIFSQVFIVEKNEVSLILTEHKSDSLEIIIKENILSNEEKGKVWISKVFPIDKKIKEDNLIFLILVKKNTDFSVGFVANFNWLINKFISPLKLTENDFAWIMDGKGRLLFHHHHEDMLLRNINEAGNDCYDCHKSFDIQNKMLAGIPSTAEYFIEGEPSKIMAYAPIELQNTKWILAISTFLPNVIADVQKSFILIVTFSSLIIVLFIMFGISFYLVNLKRIRAEESQRLLEQSQIFHEKLNHAAKLASIGELVDSVAHEINTPASVLSIEVDALILKHKLNAEFIDELKIIKQQIKRIGNYTKSLLTYSRRMPFNPIENDLLILLEECQLLLKPRLKSKKVKVNMDLPDQLEKFIFDRGRLEQVFVNIINNAIDFTNNNPRIEIKVTKMNDNKNFEWVVISIKDNGQGIPKENINLVFDPFFSTKPLSEGTGLGLSISKAIVERHNGKLELESSIGQGTTFIIYLPYIQEEENIR